MRFSTSEIIIEAIRGKIFATEIEFLIKLKIGENSIETETPKRNYQQWKSNHSSHEKGLMLASKWKHRPLVSTRTMVMAELY